MVKKVQYYQSSSTFWRSDFWQSKRSPLKCNPIRSFKSSKTNWTIFCKLFCFLKKSFRKTNQLRTLHWKTTNKNIINSIKKKKENRKEKIKYSLLLRPLNNFHRVPMNEWIKIPFLLEAVLLLIFLLVLIAKGTRLNVWFRKTEWTQLILFLSDKFFKMWSRRHKGWSHDKG
jgi:hypothetical protein